MNYSLEKMLELIETWADMVRDDRCCGSIELDSHKIDHEAVTKDIKELFKKSGMMDNIVTVTQNECDSITIPSPNPEFYGPNYLVAIKGLYSNECECIYTGESLDVALESAKNGYILENNECE